VLHLRAHARSSWLAPRCRIRSLRPDLSATGSAMKACARVVVFAIDGAAAHFDWDRHSILLSKGGCITALLPLFHGKCAFCESPIASNQSPTIEFFRPRDRALGLDGSFANDHYWWLALGLIVSARCVSSRQIEGPVPVGRPFATLTAELASERTARAACQWRESHCQSSLSSPMATLRRFAQGRIDGFDPPIPGRGQEAK